MVYIPPINNKLGPASKVLMASKTWVLKQKVARASLFLRSVVRLLRSRYWGVTPFCGERSLTSKKQLRRSRLGDRKIGRGNHWYHAF